MSWIDGLEILRDRLLGFLACGRRRLERGNRQELVDRRRLGGLFREPVALGQRGDLVGADALDQSVVLLADSRLGSRAARPFQQDFQGSVECGLRRLEMAGLELLPAGFKMLVRLSAIRSATGSDCGTGAGVRCWPAAYARAPAAVAWAHFLLPAHPTANSAMRHTPHDRPRRADDMASTYSSIRLIEGSKTRSAVPGRTMQIRCSARPARLLEDLLRFAEVPRRRRDDRPLADQQLPSRPKRRPDVVLTNELGRVIGSRRGFSAVLSCRDRLAVGGLIAAGRQESCRFCVARAWAEIVVGAADGGDLRERRSPSRAAAGSLTGLARVCTRRRGDRGPKLVGQPLQVEQMPRARCCRR